MVAGSDIRQFVFEGSGIFAKEVVDGDTKKVRQLIQFTHRAAGATLVFIVGCACHANALCHLPLGQAHLLTQGAQAVGRDVHGGNSIRLRTDSHLCLLREIVRATGAKIVLSSSWRSGPVKEIKNLRHRLAEYGLEIMDSTPVLFDCSCRCDEIRRWLDDKGQLVEKFVILDDDADMAEFTDTNLVQTDPQFGLQEEDALRCIEVLGT